MFISVIFSLFTGQAAPNSFIWLGRARRRWTLRGQPDTGRFRCLGLSWFSADGERWEMGEVDSCVSVGSRLPWSHSQLGGRCLALVGWCVQRAVVNGSMT